MNLNDGYVMIKHNSTQEELNAQEPTNDVEGE